MNVTNVNQNPILIPQHQQEALSLPIATLIPPAIAIPIANREIVQKEEHCCCSCVGWHLFFHYIVRHRYYPGYL